MLRVYPNPWAATDKDGVPCGVCPRDVDADGGGPGKFVGARIDAEHTKVLQELGPSEIRSPMQRTRYKFMGIEAHDKDLRGKLLEAEPIELPVTRFYKQRIAEGSLLAADKETARLAKVSSWVERRAKPKPKDPDTSGFGSVAPPPKEETTAQESTEEVAAYEQAGMASNKRSKRKS